MRLKSKRLVSVLLAGSMMVSMVPASAVTAFAAETKNVAVMAVSGTIQTGKTGTFQDNGFWCTIGGNNATIVGYEGTATNIVIPATVSYNGNTYPVIKIADESFKNGTELTSVTFESGIQTIGKSAFEGCTGLTGNLAIPNSVTKIDSAAFKGCSSLNGTLSISANAQTIEYEAFRECSSLTGALIIPGSVKKIDSNSFYGCKGLTGITIQKGTGDTAERTIGNRAFEGCSGLKGKLEIPNDVKSIGNYAFKSCSGLSEDLEIPSSIASMGSNVFEDCSGLNGNISIKNNAIGASEFSGCNNIKNVTIEGTIDSIGSSAFRYCTNLVSVTITGNVGTIGTSAFGGCTSLSDIKLNTVKKITSSAFNGCTSLVGDWSVPDSVELIDTGAFSNTRIEKLVLSKNVHNITITNPGVKIYYPGSRTEVEDTLTNNNVTITNLNKDTLKIGNSGYLYYDCDVEFDTVGGTPTSEKQEKIFRTKMLDKDKINTPSKEGYIFNGWYNEATKSYFNPEKDMVLDSMKLTADWKLPAAISISDFPVGEELAKGKKYPFTVTVNPKDESGTGTLCFEFANDDTMYYQKNDGEWAKITSESKSLRIPLESGSYHFILIPSQCGLDQMTVSLVTTKNSVATTSDTFSNDFVVREYKNATVTIEGLDNAALKQGESKEFTVKVTPNDDSGKAKLDFGKDNADIEYNDNGVWNKVSSDGQEINLDEGETEYVFRLTPRLGGSNQTLQVVVRPNNSELGKNDVSFDIEPKIMNSLTFTDCIATLDNGTELESGSDVEAGKTVVLKLSTNVEQMKFGGFILDPLQDSLKYVDDTTATFTMLDGPVNVTVQLNTNDSDDGVDAMTILAGAAIGAGATVLTYHIGTELYAEQVLGKGVVVPKTREEVALKAWELAGKPAVELNGEPLSETAQAEKWAVESGLMQNVDGSFNGQKKMSKLKALRVLDKAQKLG